MSLSNTLQRFSPFFYLNVTQFLGALNDNIYKLLIVYFLIQLQGVENSSMILATTGATFVLPFLLFSSSSGTMADRFSKRNIIIFSKVIELVIMVLGLIAFIYSSAFGSYCILFLMAAQSTLFSPSKYGIVRELVEPDKIAQSNGIMTSFTFLAIIFGTFLASFLVDITNRDFIISCSFCIIIALVGLFTSLCIGYTAPAGSVKRLSFHFITDIYETLKTIKNEPSLLAAVFGSSYFLFMAAYVQLNIIPFAIQSLHLTDVQGGYLFLLTALGIGTGSALAGKISGKTAELGLVPLAGAGVTISLYMLDFFGHDMLSSVAFVILTGIFGGIYLIPLDSYIQINSPKKYLGQVLAANSFLSFFGVLCSSALLYLVNDLLGFSADKGFSVIATINLIVTVLLTFQFFDYFTRFIGTILSRLHFRTIMSGEEHIPTDKPAVYVCTHTAWNDTLLLLGSQRKRMRFFIEHEQDHSKWLKRLYRLLRVVFIPEIEPFENNPECLNAIKKTLNKGISVCLFVNDRDVNHELEKLKNSFLVQEILAESQYPMISVYIEKGEKNKIPRFFRRLINKFRVPAALSFETVHWDRIPSLETHQNQPHTIKINRSLSPDFLLKTE